MKIGLCGLLLLFSLSVWAQRDVEFWFAAPAITAGNGNFNQPIVFRITAYSQSSVVTISQPARAAFPVQTVSIPADSSVTVNLTNWIDSIENKPANVVHNYGLRIVATTPVTVYYEVTSMPNGYNPEIYVLKGRAALGLDFWIPSQDICSNTQAYSPPRNSSFDIVATYDNTPVTITPSSAITGHAAGVPFTVMLNRGQTYSATSVSGAAGGHLGGSRVTSYISSNEGFPIAITIKDDVMDGGSIFGGGQCLDEGGTQLVPAPLLGTEYIAMKGALAGISDQVFVLGTVNNTIISKDGIVVDTINAGQTIQLDVGDSSTYIQSTSPASVLQLSGTGCETALDILPTINCTGTYGAGFTRTSSANFLINLLVPSGGQNTFLYNGNAGVINGSLFKNVPGTNGQWKSFQMLLPTNLLASGACGMIKNTTTPFQLGVVHGYNMSGSRFGYFYDTECWLATGMNSMGDFKGVSLFPNPVSNELNFSFRSNSREGNYVEIFNVFGQKVFEKKYFIELNGTVDVSGLRGGVYFLRIQNSENSLVQKFIKE